MKIFAETPRLILRELVPADEQGMFEMDSDPEVHKYLGNNPVTHIDQIREVIKFVRSQYDEFGIGRWAVVEKDTNQFIGWTGLKYMTEMRNGHIHFHDIGYRLLRRYWGKGYATESAIASRNYGFEVMKLNEIIGMADVNNFASVNALKKTGLTHIENFSMDNETLAWMKITRNDWEALKK